MDGFHRLNGGKRPQVSIRCSQLLSIRTSASRAPIAWLIAKFRRIFVFRDGTYVGPSAIAATALSFEALVPGHFAQTNNVRLLSSLFTAT